LATFSMLTPLAKQTDVAYEWRAVWNRIQEASR
jgi:hypothetical protein